MSDAFLAAMSRVDRCSPRSLLLPGTKFSAKSSFLCMLSMSIIPNHS